MITLRVKIYPNSAQVLYLGQLFGCYRKVYNLCLAESIRQYEATGSGMVTRTDFGHYFHRVLLKDPSLSYLKDHNTKILKDSLSNLAKAFTNFFRGAGYPQYKRRSNSQSVSLYKEAFSKHALSVPDFLLISKRFGMLRYRTSPEYKSFITEHGSELRRISLVKTVAGEYFANLLFDGDMPLHGVLDTDSVVGVDLGITTHAVCSDGVIYESLGVYAKGEKRLRRLQRQMSRKVRGSNNRNKQRLRLAKCHNDLRNRNLAAIHKMTSSLTNENQVVVIEDLNVGGMIRNHKLARSIQSQCFGEIRRQLTYKCARKGRELVVVDRFYPSSKLCHVCGYRNSGLRLSDRSWTCPECGTVHDRDMNAALNIRQEGIRVLGMQRAKELKMSRAPMSRIYACGDTSYGRPSVLSGLRSSVSRNQEVAKLC